MCVSFSLYRYRTICIRYEAASGRVNLYKMKWLVMGRCKVIDDYTLVQ